MTKSGNGDNTVPLSYTPHSLLLTLNRAFIIHKMRSMNELADFIVILSQSISTNSVAQKRYRFVL